MRLAGRYFIFFPLKAAYQGWLDEATLWADRRLSNLISYHAELPQSGFGSRAALFYSLIESAKLGGVEPKAYLRRAARAALANPGTVTLPHELPTV
jgi:hypothetical protein